MPRKGNRWQGTPHWGEVLGVGLVLVLVLLGLVLGGGWGG
jgi:hypothetical protein